MTAAILSGLLQPLLRQSLSLIASSSERLKTSRTEALLRLLLLSPPPLSILGELNQTCSFTAHSVHIRLTSHLQSVIQCKCDPGKVKNDFLMLSASITLQYLQYIGQRYFRKFKKYLYSSKDKKQVDAAAL